LARTLVAGKAVAIHAAHTREIALLVALARHLTDMPVAAYDDIFIFNVAYDVSGGGTIGKGG
jgi:hypothetical protein